MPPIDIDRLITEFTPIANDAGCELLHVEFQGGRLKVFLEHPEGVTLKHCQTVSREISAQLDVVDWGPSRYVLEVSSPGLDRKLYKAQDYERFQGERVRVTWRDPVDRRKQTVIGQIDRYEPEGGGSIALSETENEKQYNIALKDIELARLEPEL